MDQDYLRNAIRRNTIDPIIYYNEEWRKIEFIPNIKPIYWISNYGRVYNKTTNYIMDGHIIPNGYEIVSFYLIDGTRIWRHVHRLVMLAFKPIENSDMYVVNHIDGVKRIITYGIWNGQHKKVMWNMHSLMVLENTEKIVLIQFLLMNKFIKYVNVWKME